MKAQRQTYVSLVKEQMVEIRQTVYGLTVIHPQEVRVKAFWMSLALGVLLLAAGAQSFGARVVCTTTVIGDIVSRIADPRVAVEVLFSPDTDPHAFEPKPQDLVTLHGADVIFTNGLDLEAGLASILRAFGDVVVPLSEELPGLRFGEPDHQDPEHGIIDPHVWFDPTLVSLWVDIIASKLSAFDPLQESAIRTRATAYQMELSSLDEWIVSEIEKIPPERRRIVTDHHVFGYFEARYGLEQVGTVFPGLSTLSEPSARDIATLVSTIISLDIPAIFVGTTVNSSLAQQIAADTGIRIIPLYTGSLSDSDGPASTYLDLMRNTVSSLVEGLASTP